MCIQGGGGAVSGVTGIGRELCDYLKQYAIQRLRYLVMLLLAVMLEVRTHPPKSKKDRAHCAQMDQTCMNRTIVGVVKNKWD